MSAGPALERLSAFAATSFVSDPVANAPPDTQVAVGPVYVGEAVNTALVLWSRSGTFVGEADLDAFFGLPSGYEFSDPKLVYDRLSGRWFLSGFAMDSAFDSNMLIAVSDSSDPTAGWSAYEIASYAGLAMDQPNLGVSSDKVVLSWNDYAISATVFVGQETWVLQKSDLLMGASVQDVGFSPDPSRSSVVPATSTTPTSTEYLVYNNTCSGASGFGDASCSTGTATIGVVAISGTPANGDVAWNENDPALVQTSTPPPAAQPIGPAIDTNDDRLLSAVWQNGELWTTANDACLPGGVVQSCLRVVAVSTAATPAVLVDGDVGISGEDVYYPAIALDGSGAPFVVGTASSSLLYPSVAAFAEPLGSGGFVGGVVWNGTGSYSCSFCGIDNNRWGDYSGAAIDPVNPSDVWVAGEYGTAPGGDDWGTAINEVTLSGPSVTALSQHSGPVAGGTHLTVHGTNFTSGTSVRFGTAAATRVTVQSATQLVATAPAHAAGTVHVTAVTTDGTSAPSAADSFTYTKPAPPPPPPPASGAGYWMVGATGSVYAFGDAHDYGSASVSSVTHLEPTPSHHGYWIVDAAGQVSAFGNARGHGNASGLAPGETVSSLSTTATGNGYWLFTNRGRALPFGDAHFYGDMSGKPLNGPIVGSVATPTGHGYYMVASDGGIFTFGDAHFHGSMGGTHLNKPVNGLVPTPDNRGYWLVASDGGIFAFHAPFRGSAGGLHLNRPVIGIVRYGNGYLMVGSDGGIFDFSNEAFVGSLGAHPPAAPIVGVGSTG